MSPIKKRARARAENDEQKPSSSEQQQPQPVRKQPKLTKPPDKSSTGVPSIPTSTTTITTATSSSTTKPASATSSGASTAASTIQTVVSDLLDEIEKLQSNIRNGNDENNNDRTTSIRIVKNKILQLKAIQRQLYDQVSIQKQRFDILAMQNEKHVRHNAANLYEYQYLQLQINKCQQYTMNNLYYLVKDEMNISKNNSNNNDNNESNQQLQEEVEIINQFLNSNNNSNNNNTVDVSNPNERNSVLGILHQQLEKRAMLENQLKKKQSELTTLSKQLQLKYDFLNNLPNHLHNIERATQPLIKFMAKINSNNNAVAISKDEGTNSSSCNEKITVGGKERLTRLDLAQGLVPPLYTLFTLLQHYADANVKAMLVDPNSIINTNASSAAGVEDDDVTVSETNETSSNTNNSADVQSATKVTVKVVVPADKKLKDQQLVTLQLPVHDYSATTATTTGAVAGTTNYNISNKKVSIHFRYYPHLAVITAQATGCGSTLNQDILLDELFPGDTTIAAERMISTKLGMTIQPKKDATTANNSSNPQLIGIPYQWCNVLGGLYQVPTMDGTVGARSTSNTDSSEQKEDNQSVLVHSTRVVISELFRRIQSNAILKYCLQSLKRNQIPVPPPAAELGTDPQDSFIALSSKWKLVDFSPLSSDVNTNADREPIYQVTINNGPKTLVATVQIQMSRYPAVPPKWNILMNDDEPGKSRSSDNPPLYDARIARFQQRINVDMLKQSKDGTKMKSETHCEWILIHQIREMIDRWDELSNTIDSGSGHYREVRGRDHVGIDD